jgi:hypothetical protein
MMNQFAQVVSICSLFVGCVAATATSAPHLVTETSSIRVAQGKQSKPTIEDNDFKFELQGCQRSGESVRCNLVVTNIGDKDRPFTLRASYSEPISRIITKSGEEFGATLAESGKQKHNVEVELRLIQGVPVRAALKFERIPRQVSDLAVLEIGYRFFEPYGTARVQFRNVSIQPK